MMNGYEAGKGHFSCYSPCRFREKGCFAPVGSHSDALRRGVGYRLEFRLLSYVNTQLRSPCEKAWAPIVQRVRFSATKAQPFWQVEW